LSSSCQAIRGQPVAKFLARLECYGFAGCDLNRFAGLGIPSLAGLLVFHYEAAKPAKVNAFAGLQDFADFSQEGLNNSFYVDLRSISGGGDSIDQLWLCHSVSV